MDQDLRPDDKKAGWEWEVELARHIVGFASVDRDNEKEMKEWEDRLGKIEESLGDKYLAKRFAVSRAKSEAEHFKALAKKYTAQAKKYERIADDISAIAVRDMQMHAESTGELEIKLKDNTRIKLYERSSKVVYYNDTPASQLGEWALDGVPEEYLDRKLRLGHLKNALAHTEVPGFHLVETSSSYVRWL